MFFEEKGKNLIKLQQYHSFIDFYLKKTPSNYII